MHIFHSHLILSFAWSPSAVDEPSIGASSGRESDSKVTLVTPLVEVVSIDVTVMDGIWADMLALQKVVLIEILTKYSSTFNHSTSFFSPIHFATG